ncbi:hypothetical protein QYE76_032678 [Lolium multiflorum]|uniref:Integrase catalytic domain-containing protein n=1 Tax=Lolium multiflorum TaxID=4521 RepID=A0AAD8VLD9_LOLMU|nr:hypothetical protein QYE76_032678 [Lolium multiflorum]
MAVKSPREMIPSRQGAGGDLLNPRDGIGGGVSGRFSVSWLSMRGFTMKTICRRKGRSGGHTRAHTPGRATSRAAPPAVAAPRGHQYEALIHGMKMAKACGATRLKIFGDSQLVAQQVMNQCDAVNDSMVAYKEVYNELEKLFDGCEVNHIIRLSNDEADVLANIGSQCLAIPPGVFWEEITERSTKPKKSTKKEKDEKPSGAAKETLEEEEEQDLVLMWGLDMVGKLHKASPGGYEYMLVAVDKFTKWIEAKPINSPDAASAIKFMKSIVFRFGVPHSIVTDNGSNFTSKEFKAVQR